MHSPSQFNLMFPLFQHYKNEGILHIYIGSSHDILHNFFCKKEKDFLFILSYNGVYIENNPLNFIGCAKATAHFAP